MNLEDHFVINVARLVEEGGIDYGPRYEAYLRIELPACRTKREAIEIHREVKGKYPAPDYSVDLSRVSVRNSEIVHA